MDKGPLDDPQIRNHAALLASRIRLTRRELLAVLLRRVGGNFSVRPRGCAISRASEAVPVVNVGREPSRGAEGTSMEIVTTLGGSPPTTRQQVWEKETTEKVQEEMEAGELGEMDWISNDEVKMQGQVLKGTGVMEMQSWIRPEISSGGEWVMGTAESGKVFLAEYASGKVFRFPSREEARGCLGAIFALERVIEEVRLHLLQEPETRCRIYPELYRPPRLHRAAAGCMREAVTAGLFGSTQEGFDYVAEAVVAEAVAAAVLRLRPDLFTVYKDGAAGGLWVALQMRSDWSGSWAGELETLFFSGRRER